MRTTSQRQADTIHRLESDENVWLATASRDAIPHLIALSLAWDGDRLLLATATDSPTVRNAIDSAKVKVNLDNAADVVLIDGTVQVVDFAAADPAMVQTFVDRVGWNPGNESGAWSMLIVSPTTIRAWNSVAEIDGRTIMRSGSWT